MKNYSSTTIPPERTKADIEKLLKEHGIKDIQWTTLHDESNLKFIHHFTLKGVEKTVGFELRPPYIAKKVRQYNKKTYGYDIIEVPNDPQAYRLLFWYLKNMLLAVEYGMTTLEQVLMSHIIISLPSGEQTTLGKPLLQAIESGTVEKLLSLPSTSRNEKKVIDV